MKLNALTIAAREAVTGVINKKPYDSKDLEKGFPEKKAVFVSYSYNGEQRGSVGFAAPVHGLGRSVVMLAKSAAFEDPRFPALKKEILPKVKFKVDILEKLAETKTIKPGQGCIVKFGPYEGVLLPSETKIMKTGEILENCCQKAGIAPETLTDPLCKTYSFTTKEILE